MTRTIRHKSGFSLIVAFFFFLSLMGAQGASRSTSNSAGAGERARKPSSSSSKKKTTEGQEKKGKDEEEKPKESLFLPEPDQSQAYTPEIFRCAECGYEQDELGVCPDHESNQLILVLSKGKNPLEPPEVDGNEDLLVDIPLTNVTFKKKGSAASDTSPLSKPSATTDTSDSTKSTAPAPNAPTSP